MSSIEEMTMPGTPKPMTAPKPNVGQTNTTAGYARPNGLPKAPVKRG